MSERVGDGGDTSPGREEVARLILGDPKLAPLVTGNTAREMTASAAEVGRLFREHHAGQTHEQVDFNGGVREPVPGPGPTHEEWLSEVLNRNRDGDGSGWG